MYVGNSDATGGVTVLSSYFDSNSALDSGGGALHLTNSESYSVLAGCYFINNVAPHGGGGAILWDADSPIFCCAPGAFRMTESSFGCMLCPAGTFQTGICMEGTESCVNCAAGTFSYQTGASECTACGPGEYLNRNLTTVKCEQCVTGKYMSGIGAMGLKGCTSCSSGTFSSLEGASTCLLCQGGSFSTVLGAISSATCSGLCTSGYYSISGSSACMLCEAGTFTSFAEIGRAHV